MRMSIKAVVVTAATTVLIAPAATALAASTAVTDSTNDTWTVTYDDQTGTPTYTKSDVTDNVDVKKTVIKIGKRVQVTQKYADLSKQGVDFNPAALIMTNKGDASYMVGVVNDASGSWTHGGFLVTGPQSGRVSARAGGCDTLRTSIDWKNNVFTMSAPTSCLGKGVKWIKVHASGNGQTYDEATDTYTNYVDNAHNDTGNDRGWTGRIHKG